MLSKEAILEAYNELRDQAERIEMFQRGTEEEYRIVPERLRTDIRAKFEARDALLWVYRHYERIEDDLK